MNLLFRMKVIFPGPALKRNLESYAISNNLLICIFYTDLISLCFKLDFCMEIIKRCICKYSLKA